MVDPRAIFERLTKELPAELREHVYVIGSLAGAFHYASELSVGGVKTKDADLVVFPAMQRLTVAEIAETLLKNGWKQKQLTDFPPGTAATPPEKLPAIRL